MKYVFGDMGDPLFMAYTQAQIDACALRCHGIPFGDALPRIIARMRFLFGDDVPVRMVYESVRRAYRQRAREGAAK